jgi:histidinol-phosphate aminotransferase
MASFNLQTLARPNILALEPYRCARDDYKVGVLLDANENTHGPSLKDLDDDEAKQQLHRYPDPHQIELKQLMCDFRNSQEHPIATTIPPLQPENLFVGVGSDEAIDAIIRILCVPGKDKLLTCPPTYGMYSVSAHINDVKVETVNMKVSKGQFSIKPEAIITRLAHDPTIKLVYICSPGNPTGSLVDRKDIIKVLDHPTWNGMVVVDEAYIDFASDGSSMAPLVNKYPNLIVLQTLSKSFGLAGARCGVAFSSPEMATLMNSMKAPYNISTPTSKLAIRALSPEGVSVMRDSLAKIKAQRERLVRELPRIPGIGEFIGGQDANFLLVEILSSPGSEPSNEMAKRVYESLAEKSNVVVRYRGSEPGCMGCLRISVGTSEETDVLLKEFKDVLGSCYSC